MSIGDRIRAIRKDRGLNQEDFGAKIGITAAAVSKIENGRNNPDGATVTAISQVFCVSEPWIVTGKGNPGDFGNYDDMFTKWVSNHLNGETNDFKRRFMRVIMSFSDSDWKLIEKWVNDMKNPPGE